jgi:S1-C subfamily serine protease
VYRQAEGEAGMGMGFSVPVKQVAAALSQFFTPEVTDSLWFGAQLKAGAGPLAVTTVREGSPADRAGLRVGDRILQVNGRKVERLIPCSRLLARTNDHQTRLTIARGTERSSLKVEMVTFEKMFRERLGLNLAPVPAARGRASAAPEGLMVEKVEPGSPAGEARLQKGFLVTECDGVSTKDTREAGVILAGKNRGDFIRLTIIAPRQLASGYVELRQGMVELEVR